MAWTDWLDGIGIGALGGAGTGALVGGPIGAAIGGVGGGLLGAFSEYQGDKRKSTLNDASRRSREMAMEQRRYQEEGMRKALEQLGPAQAAYKALYGDPASWRL